MLADVERQGWHVIWIRAADGIPGWAFTVGLMHSFGVPELATFGLSDQVGYTTLNMVGELVREGDRLRPGSRVGEVLEGYDLELRAGDPAWSDALFGSAQWFYRRREPAFVQCVWPDMSGRFPWEPGFEERLRRFQPALWMSPTESPVGPWRAWWYETTWRARDHAKGLVFASKRVASGEAPALRVQVFDDGDWVFLDGESVGSDDVVLSHLHHLLEDDPTLEETAGFEVGTVGWRAAPGEPWSVAPLDD